jgi:hypothetical protein
VSEISFTPTLLVVREGPFYFGDEGNAVMIVLHNFGKLDTTINHPEYGGMLQRVSWGPGETIMFLRSKSQLKSEGSGMMVCLGFGYQPPLILKPTGSVTA